MLRNGQGHKNRNILWSKIKQERVHHHDLKQACIIGRCESITCDETHERYGKGTQKDTRKDHGTQEPLTEFFN